MYTPHQLAEALPPSVREVELFNPTLHYRTLNEADLDSCMDWHADIVALADTGHDVFIGHVEFLTLRFGGEPGMSYAELFDSYSADVEPFRVLFDHQWLRPEIEAQFDGISIEHVVLVFDVYISRLLRGHRLGPWAIADVAHRMLTSHTGLIVVPTGGEEGPSTPALTEFERRRGVKPANHWAQAGLVAIDKHPDLLAGSAAFTHLETARKELADADRATYVLTVDAIRASTWPRYSAQYT
jgi:hypothetical protein